MNAINDHLFAIKLSVLQLKKGKIWLYIIPPVAVALCFYSIFAFFQNISDGAEVAKEIPLLGDYVTTGVQKTIGFMVWITDEFYKFFILSLLSPINCLLSEKVDNEVTGAKFDGGFARVMKDIGRAIFLLFFTLMLNFLVMFIWYILSWIFGLHIVDNIVYFVIGAFFIGFSFYDFSLERYGVGFFGAIEFGFERMLYMLLTGTVFSVIYMIPILGVILAPFLVTIISTIVYTKMSQKIPQNL